MRSPGPMPELGNLAWAPLSAVDEVEIFDRYNGVPTLGVARSGHEVYLFWRAVFYLDDSSLWLYVPLTAADREHVDADDDSDLMDGLVFRSPVVRYVTVGVAHMNRLVFEREWCLPAGLSPERVCRSLLDFAYESMKVALDQNPPLPPSRRDVVRKASDAVRELIPAH